MVPKHTGGFNIFGNYKGFDFSLGFTYALGGKVYNANAYGPTTAQTTNRWSTTPSAIIYH